MSVEAIPQARPARDMVRRRDFEGGVAVLTMNRPEAYNALSTELMQAMLATLDDLAADPKARAVVIEGEGRGFCSGHDLKEIHALESIEARRALMALCCELMVKVVRLPKPVIAKVHGVATAAGCQLVASCDLAIAADDARFATPGVNFGLFCHTPMVALSRNVSRKHAMRMLLTGEMIDAATAEAMGLINGHVPQPELDDAVLELARKIASKSSHTLKVGKEAFYRQLDLDLDQAYAYAAETMVQNMMARDAVEGIDAFLGKRAPDWRDA